MEGYLGSYYPQEVIIYTKFKDVELMMTKKILKASCNIKDSSRYYSHENLIIYTMVISTSVILTILFPHLCQNSILFPLSTFFIPFFPLFQPILHLLFILVSFFPYDFFLGIRKISIPVLLVVTS